MDQVNDSNFPFLRLPSEVRNKIYRYLLSTKHTKRVSALGYEECVPTFVKLCPSHRYEFHTTILLGNHQLYGEAASILYGENLFICLATNLKAIQRLCYNVGLKPVSYGTRAAKWKHIAMSIVFSQDGDDSKKTLRCVFACDDLHLLCRGFLGFGMNDGNGLVFLQDLRFTVTIHGSSEAQIHALRYGTPSASSKLCRLLEPFTKLHSIGRFTIIGLFNGEYRAYIAGRVTGSAPNLESAIEGIVALKDEGNVAFCKNQDALAIAKYEAALISLLTSFWDHATIQTGEFANLIRSNAACILYFQLQSNLAATLLRTGRFVDCHYWAGHAFAQTATEKAMVHRKPAEYSELAILQALASKGMGEIERAAKEMRTALIFEPENATARKELVDLEAEVEVKKNQDLAFAMGG
ncbi:hypothetical protein HO173_009561 [Letharia columbiana]|uniref:Uncharacterized protein n=1 Tax=Letharia columbiana TaxID=112416 RepID=A0A8H6FPA1_9LECA|nr:uncharacterized protein HO173_009561 [Letharia columbiana]KAF6232178.1 hypothetical protein HO173_009561 [Letharia columbiana]